MDLKFKINDVTDCWEWQGSKDRDGYGTIKIDGKVYKAHRISFMLMKGSLRNKHHLVCHVCDNPPCINPNHLFSGSARDNARDRHKKGRTVMPDTKGEKHPNARLTDKDISNIKTCGLSVEKIANIYKIKKWYVRQIISGKRRQDI